MGLNEKKIAHKIFLLEVHTDLKAVKTLLYTYSMFNSCRIHLCLHYSLFLNWICILLQII